MAKSDEQVVEEFHEAVNMDADELNEWLHTDESKSVGQSDDGGRDLRATSRGAGSSRSSRRTRTTSTRTT